PPLQVALPRADIADSLYGLIIDGSQASGMATQTVKQDVDSISESPKDDSDLKQRCNSRSSVSSENSGYAVFTGIKRTPTTAHPSPQTVKQEADSISESPTRKRAGSDLKQRCDSRSSVSSEN